MKDMDIFRNRMSLFV